MNRQKNIFIANRAADNRDSLYKALKAPYKSSMRVWTYPLYIAPGFLIGFAGQLPGQLTGAVAAASFILGNAIFFEVNRLRRRCERAIELIISMEDVRINGSVDELAELE
ncbi:MAG: hypothetical protein WC617_05340 [Rhodanobacter sp.]